MEGAGAGAGAVCSSTRRLTLRLCPPRPQTPAVGAASRPYSAPTRPAMESATTAAAATATRASAPARAGGRLAGVAPSSAFFKAAPRLSALFLPRFSLRMPPLRLRRLPRGETLAPRLRRCCPPPLPPYRPAIALAQPPGPTATLPPLLGARERLCSLVAILRNLIATLATMPRLYMSRMGIGFLTLRRGVATSRAAKRILPLAPLWAAMRRRAAASSVSSDR